MIPRTCPQDTDWRSELRQAITEPEELLEILRLPKSRWLTGARLAAREFPLKVPRGFVARMKPSNPHDPLLRQVLPLAEELERVAGFTEDPVGDIPASSEPGLIHKYSGRSLMITTGACAIHCRYCFRRHFPYANSHVGGTHLNPALSSIRENTDLREVILSGGDPLMMDDQSLGRLLSQISQMSHIQRIRIHSRLPIVLPERITDSLITTLSIPDQPVIMVIHCNHSTEIDNNVQRSLLMMHLAGIRLFNQSVLLRGVNDDDKTLTDLSETLFEHHVQPYYLHLLDRVHGSAHFDIPEHQAKSLYQSIQAQLPGYLVPRLVKEIQGKPSKTTISV